MNITQASLKNPAAVAVAVALVVVFGLLAMTRLPLQLFPDIDQPQMSVVTNWRAASPSEIESEILEPQEEVLQGLNGLERIDGNATVDLVAGNGAVLLGQGNGQFSLATTLDFGVLTSAIAIVMPPLTMPGRK